jgi:DNA-binding NarL/FixJ family response regulator
VSDRTIDLLLIDDDPIFRFGLSQGLSIVSGVRVTAQSDTVTILNQSVEPSPNVIILDPLFPDSHSPNWSLCQLLQQNYPKAKILLLGSQLTPTDLDHAQRLGLDGYCPKGTNLDNLVVIIRQIASNQPFWSSIAATPNPAFSVRRSHWLIRMTQSGIEQIDQELTNILHQLNQGNLSRFDELYWNGRKRELLAASWLIRKLLPVEVAPSITPNTREIPRANPVSESALSLVSSSLPVVSIPRSLSTTTVYEDTLEKLRFSLDNSTDIPLEIDILQAFRRRELFYIVFEQTRKILDEIKFLDLEYSDLLRRKDLILLEIWQKSTQKFLETSYSERNDFFRAEVDRLLLRDLKSVENDILKRIPFVNELFAYLLFEQSIIIDQVAYRVDSPEEITRAEILLENLVIQISNGVMTTILNNFPELELIKKNLYNNNFISSREVAKFRNDLSWKYRKDKYVEHPQDIFESKYRLLYFRENKIRQLFIYAPRQDELYQLKGIPWLVTITLEFKDAVAPRLRSIFSFLGKGVIYILTKVIGRGIGLIVLGILQGMGNTWQELRYSRNGQQNK